MKTRKHDCRKHVVRRVVHKQRTFASGGKVGNRCSVCGKHVKLRMQPNEVLMRMPDADG